MAVAAVTPAYYYYMHMMCEVIDVYVHAHDGVCIYSHDHHTASTWLAWICMLFRLVAVVYAHCNEYVSE